MKKLYAITALAFLSLTMAAQNVFLVEHFNYPANDSLQNNGWYGHSAPTTNPIQVTNGGLSWSQTSYLGSGVGNAAGVDNTGADENRPFNGSPNSGNVYVSFLMRVRGVVHTANSGYFLHIGQYLNTTTPVFTAINSAFRARTFIATGSSASKYKVGLAFNSSTVPTGTDLSADLDTGTTYLVVLKYQFVAGTLNDVVSMYLFADGANIATEPAIPTVGPLAATLSATDLDFVQLVALRQYSSTQNITVDGLIAQNSWNLMPPQLAGPALVSPPNNTVLNVAGPTATPVVASWTKAANATGPVAYQWQLAQRAAGNFNNPASVLASDNSGADTTLSLTYGSVNALLASLGVNVGDTVEGMWRVRAINAGDTVYSNTFNIDIVRGVITGVLQPFSLLTPANNSTLLVAGPGQTPVNVTWQDSDNQAIYQWRAFLPGGSVNAPLLTLPSNNSGNDPALTLSIAQIDAILAGLAVGIGDTATIQWSVRATLGGDSLFATAPFTLTLVRIGVATPTLVAAPQYVLSPGTTGLSGPSGTATAKYFRAAQIVLPAEYAAANIANGDGIRSVGFVLNAAPTTAVTGIMKVYLQNSTDASYLESTTWTNIIDSMTLVHNVAVTIPAGATQYNMAVNQNFIYTGGSMYLAYEFEQTSPALTTGLVYRANTAVPNSIRRAQSATAFPAVVTGVSAFRLEVLWGVDRDANDLEIVTIWAKGRNAINYGTPEQVDVIVRNNGYLPANKVVSFASAGANTSTATANVSLASGQSDTLSFTYTPTTAGFSVLTASVPADDVATNNSRTWVQEATTNTMGYADTTQTGLGSVGYNTASGLLINRYAVNGIRAVNQVKVRIANNPASVGNVVYAVVVDTSGAIVAQSANVTLATTDLNTWKTFTFANPAVFDDEDFFVGIAQTANTVGYFPVAFQTEQPTRPNAYFGADLTGANLGAVNGFRLMIEAVLGTPPACPLPTSLAAAATCDDATITWTSSTSNLGSKVQYGPAGFTPGTGTIVTATGGTYAITGLANGTAYDVWVKDSCQYEVSTWVGPVTFTTEDIADVTAGSNQVNTTTTFATVDFTATINNGAAVTSYSWDYGDSSPAGSGATPSHNYQANGTYTVIVTATNACGMGYDTITVNVNGISIDEYGFGNIGLYPNPNDGYFTLTGLTDFGNDATIEVINLAGAVVYAEKVVANGSESFRIDVRGLPAGMYQMRVSSEKGMGAKPFIIR